MEGGKQRIYRIDIEKVQGNIVRVKAELAEAKAQIEKYLKELGLYEEITLSK